MPLLVDLCSPLSLLSEVWNNNHVNDYSNCYKKAVWAPWVQRWFLIFLSSHLYWVNACLPINYSQYSEFLFLYTNKDSDSKFTLRCSFACLRQFWVLRMVEINARVSMFIKSQLQRWCTLNTCDCHKALPLTFCFVKSKVCFTF